MLEPEERSEIVQALQAWLEYHPEPDEPSLRMSAEGELSPRELVQSVEEDDETGEAFFEILEYSIRRSSLETVVSDLRNPPVFFRAIPT